MNARAVYYRKLHDIPEDWGTACNVQAMVFGNLGDDSATGVAFTRNPSTGQKHLYGEWLPNAQGEDVVAGIRTPMPIRSAGKKDSLEEKMPLAFAQLNQIAETLEKHFRDMQDLEFTIQNGKLYMLQCRNGKRTSRAAVRIAVEMVKERLDRREGSRPSRRAGVAPSAPSPDARSGREERAPRARPRGVARRGERRDRVRRRGGEEALDAGNCGDSGARRDFARRHSGHAGLARHPDGARRHDVARRGRRARHGQALRRGHDVGAGSLRQSDGDVLARGRRPKGLKKGDPITIDGGTGEVFFGAVPTVPAGLFPELEELMAWADKHRVLKVRANADTPHDAATARAFGAEGIGLCRTEHMFFGEERITAMREMIVAETKEQREHALTKLLPFQRKDFIEIFRAMNGLPVTIRLLDPPLHEFLPTEPKQIEQVARAWASRRKPSRSARRISTSRTRCSATAAAASRSRTPRSTRCRRARSSKPRRP